MYRVKRDGRKSSTSQLISNKKEPVKMLTLVKGNEMKRSIVESQSAKSEENKLRVHKAKKELPLDRIESHPRCPLGLSYWKKKELQNHSAQELRKKNMAWVPKASTQNNNYVLASITRSATR